MEARIPMEREGDEMRCEGRWETRWMIIRERDG